MTIPGLDLDRFRKCIGLMKRGATPGERSAAMAAAGRVAAAAGLSLEDAVLRLDRGGVTPETARRHPQPSAPSWASRRTKPPKPRPMTVAEAVAKKAADLERRKKALAREERKQEELRQEIEKLFAEDRARQVIRDREWAEARARQQQG